MGWMNEADILRQNLVEAQKAPDWFSSNLVELAEILEPRHPTMRRFVLDEMCNPRQLPVITVDVYIMEKSVMFFKRDPNHPREWYRFKTIWG